MKLASDEVELNGKTDAEPVEFEPSSLLEEEFDVVVVDEVVEKLDADTESPNSEEEDEPDVGGDCLCISSSSESKPNSSIRMVFATSG